MLVFIPLFIFYLSYHLVVPYKKAVKEPQSCGTIKKNTGRVFQLGSGLSYMEELTNYGWKNPAYYLYAKNSLDANINVIYKIPQTGLYFPLMTERQNVIQNLLVWEAQADTNQMTATISSLHKKILNLTSTRFLISPFKIITDELILKKIIIPDNKDWLPFYIYENPGSLSRFRLVNDYQSVDSHQEALAKIKNTDFDPKTSVILENIPLRKLEQATVKSISVIKDQDEEIIADVKIDKKSIFVLADSYLPGWMAYIDDNPVFIYAANINQRAVFVPAGKHRIRFVYKPQSYQQGMKTSIIFFIIWLILLVLNNLGRFRLFQKS